MRFKGFGGESLQCIRAGQYVNARRGIHIKRCISKLLLTNSMYNIARTIFEIGWHPGGWGVGNGIFEGVGGVNKT